MKHLTREEIDSIKWNQTVVESNMSRHYYLTHFLDATSPNWSALIWEDYEVIWPLPTKRLPVKRVYQPLLAQQLGPLARQKVLTDIILQGLEYLKQTFSSYNVKFNDSISDIPGQPTSAHHNISLDLHGSYENIAKGYNRNIRSNLNKAAKAGVKIIESAEGSAFVIGAFKDSHRSQDSVLNSAFYKDVTSIYEAFYQKGEATTFLATLDQKPIAGMMVLKMNGRLLNFFTATINTARGVGAMHAIIDHLIRLNCNQAMVLDFEGSDDDNLRFFYQSFGGEDRIYLQLQISQLNWPLNKILK